MTYPLGQAMQPAHLSYSLNSLRGVVWGFVEGVEGIIARLIQGDTRSSDYTTAYLAVRQNSNSVSRISRSAWSLWFRRLVISRGKACEKR